MMDVGCFKENKVEILQAQGPSLMSAAFSSFG
jgi:hypothetical protein